MFTDVLFLLWPVFATAGRASRSPSEVLFVAVGSQHEDPAAESHAENPAAANGESQVSWAGKAERRID